VKFKKLGFSASFKLHLVQRLIIDIYFNTKYLLYCPFQWAEASALDDQTHADLGHTNMLLQ